MKQITCENCTNWMSRDDINGVCTLVNVSVPGDATCEYAEEGDDEPTQGEKCEDCIHNGTNKDKITCKECASAEAVQGGRYENAMQKLREMPRYLNSVKAKQIKKIPPEAVQGEWIDINNYYRLATCSRCHKVTMFEKWGEYTKPYDFCPNCGARMTPYKGGEDDNA